MRQELSQERREADANEKVVVQTPDGPKTYERWAVAAMQEIQAIAEAEKKGVKVRVNMAKWLPKDIDLIVNTYAAGLPVLERLSETDLNDLTPLQALTLLAELKENITRTGWKWEL